MRTSTLTVALLSVLVVASAGTAGALTTSPLQAQASPTNTTTSGGDAATQGSPSVTFENQDSSGESLLVASATLPRKGFVAVYDSSRSGNRTDQIIGVSYLLEPGTADNIRIQLDESLDSSASLTAVVHADTNGNGEFDYVSSDGQEDAPLTPQGDRRIVDIAQVTVENAGGANETADDTANTTATTTADDGAANATTGETTTDGMTTADETTAEETTTDETTAEETTADETTAGDATEAPAAANGTAANDTNGSGDSGGSGAFGPGFGPVVAVVALLAAALLVSRRRQ